MRQLLPPAGETPVAATYGDIVKRAADRAADRAANRAVNRAAAAPDGRPYLALNMVASADGAISYGGLSGGLSSSADKEVFFYLRSLADVILVGATTARAENYGPARLSAQLVAEREARGQQPLPRIAVVTRSMRLDWSGRLFAAAPTEPQPERPYVICPSAAPADQREAAGQVAEVISAGETAVDLKAALTALAAAGACVVVCEGGPMLNGELLTCDLVDELCLTISPALVGGVGKTISGWEKQDEARPLELLTVVEADGALLLRYGVGPAVTTATA